MKALVIGGAKSGYGASLLLQKLGYEVVLVSRDDFKGSEELENLGIKVILDDTETDVYDAYDLVVKNPGIPNNHQLVKRFDTVYNEIEIAFNHHTKGKYYAISGTNGKTTTTTLLHEMLKRKSEGALLAGNIGIALSEMIYKLGNEPVDVALEISAFQMEGAPNFAPEVYALLNLTPDHLDRFKDEESYYKAKLTPIKKAKWFIRNLDDKNIARLTIKDEHTLDVSLSNDADIYIQDEAGYIKETKLFDLDILKVVGEHNIFNALVASSMAYLANVVIEDIRYVLSNFKGVEHRLEYVDEIDGVRYYNDSKATNPESTEVALKSFDQSVILLAGGYDKKISFDLLKDYPIKLAILYGESKYQLAKIFKNYILVENLEEAMKVAQEKSTKGDVVLLSPACASYDQFENFETRGNLFKDIVKSLK